MNIVLKKHVFPNGQLIQIVQGDITTEEVDAIVNAANEHLQHGGGVAWAISNKGGDIIQRESDEWIRQHGPVSHTHPAWTSGGLLPAKYIIHAVGPVWGSGNDDQKLSDAVTGSMRVADELKCSSIAMPAISTGIFGFPKDRAAGIIFKSILQYYQQTQNSGIRTVKIVLFDWETVRDFLQAWEKIKGKTKFSLTDWVDGLDELFFG